MSANVKAVGTSEKVVNQVYPQTPPSRKASTLQPLQDEADDQTHQTRPPTPFQELQGSLHEDSQSPKDERGSVTPPPDAANAGGEAGTASCQEGKHEFKTKHGIMGILMLVALFPCGLICFLRDKQEVCTRCGIRA